MNISKSIFLVICIVTSVQVISAQYGGSPGFSRQSSLAIRQHIQRQELRNAINRRRMMNRSQRLSKRKGASSNRTPIRKIASGPTAFTVKELILPTQVSNATNGNLADQRRTAEAVKALWNKYQAVALKDGFPSNDLAYTFCFYVVHNYAVYNDYFNNHRIKFTKKTNSAGLQETAAEYKQRTELKITNPIEKKIYSQYKDYLSANDGIKKMTNNQKQLFAELLVAVTQMTFDFYVQSQTYADKSKHQAIRDAAKTNLENFFGVAADQIRITTDGLSIED